MHAHAFIHAAPASSTAQAAAATAGTATATGPTAARRCQRGSVVVTSLIALSLLMMALVGTELGYLFALKRDFQKAADLAALAGAQAVRPDDCAPAQAAAVANAARNLPAGFTLTAGDVDCGRWDPITRTAAPHYGALGTGETFNAVRVRFSRTPDLLLPQVPGNVPRTVAVEAFAAQRAARAALNIRTALVTLDSSKSALLNAVLGGMLGGSLNLTAADWNGLVGTQVNLLGYLDQLALKLGVQAGRYDEVLSTPVSVGTLVDAMVSALQVAGNTTSVAVNALNQIKVAANVASAQPLVRLGDLLDVQTGTPAAGLDLGLEAFQVVQGLVQLANKQNALVASVQLLPGVTANVKVIEAPQVSAVGDPELAALDPTGVNAIRVRTAQVRTLISLDFPGLSGASALTTAVANVLSPVTNALNLVLTAPLSLVSDVLSCVLVCTKDVSYAELLPGPIRVDIGLDAGGAQSYVSDVDCTRNNTELTAQTRTSLADLRIGKMGATAAEAKTNAFSNAALPPVAPVPLLDIGSMRCTRILLGLIPVSCPESTKKPYWGGGLGIMATVPVAASNHTQQFANPPELDQAPNYEAVSSQNIVDSLKGTLQGANLLTVIPPTGVSSGLNNLLTTLTSLLGGVINLASSLVANALAPLLDPLLNALIRDVLGIDLAKADVGARLSCTRGAELVY